MIPKTIHYCWFGRNPKPKLTLKCIKSWKKKCPDYRIIEWNEDNFDLLSCPLYVRQAYEMKKWAFVTDFVRLKVVYEYGGIYLDTDVELIKELDHLLGYHAYFGFEDGVQINTGLGFGAEKGAEILKELMDDYIDISFVLENGSTDNTPCPQRNTAAFLNHGLVQNGSKQFLDKSILILPSDYLCPINYETGTKRITKNTLSIHWFNASWQTEQEKKHLKEKQRSERFDYFIHSPNRAFKLILGNSLYNKLKQIVKRRS